MTGNPPIARLTRAELLREIGLSPLWQLRPQPTVAVTRHVTPARPPAESIPEAREDLARRPPSTPVAAPAAARPVAIARMGWDELRQSVAGCSACALCQGRKQAVLGVGDASADWLFVGEGPGAEEDARGEPFVGPAGKLLDAMLAAIDLRRGEDVYIANAVKCRPPGNRTPEAAELAACFPFLKRQIALIEPKLIVLLGKTAVSSVLGEDVALGSLRGKNLSYRDGDSEIPVVVT